jgi:hypothetical protein
MADPGSITSFSPPSPNGWYRRSTDAGGISKCSGRRVPTFLWVSMALTQRSEVAESIARQGGQLEPLLAAMRQRG